VLVKLWKQQCVACFWLHHFAYLNVQVNPFQVISLTLKRNCGILLRKELRDVQGKELLMCFAQSTPFSQAKPA
jgi:hypothetical protein